MSINMSGGSEFALRIVLCDLVERLKRCDQQCKYLERCRNELAKELIRVKQENQIISRENSMMAASLENNLGLQVNTRAKSPRFPAPVLEGTPTNGNGNDNDPPAQDEEVIDSSTDWEEITAQLLNQLRKEVEQMAPKAMTPATVVTEDDQRNNSVGSVFVLPAPTSTISSGNKCVSVKEESTNKMKVRGEEDGMVRSSPLPSESKFGTREVDAVEVVPERRPLSANHSKGSSSSVFEREGGVDKVALDQMYVKLFKDLTLDLNKFSEQVALQNEKLTRIKSKQLRSYFKRQLKPSDNEVRPGIGGENDQYQKRQQHSRPGLAELI